MKDLFNIDYVDVYKQLESSSININVSLFTVYKKYLYRSGCLNTCHIYMHMYVHTFNVRMYIQTM